MLIIAQSPWSLKACVQILTIFEPKAKLRYVGSSSESWTMGSEAWWADPGLAYREGREGSAASRAVCEAVVGAGSGSGLHLSRGEGGFVSLVFGSTNHLYIFR